MGSQTKEVECVERMQAPNASNPSGQDLDALLSEIGQEIAARRRQCDWTQEQLAQRAGCSTNTIIAVEKGKRNVTVRSLAMISAAFGVRLTDLFPSAKEEAVPDTIVTALSAELCAVRAAIDTMQSIIFEREQKPSKT